MMMFERNQQRAGGSGRRIGRGLAVLVAGAALPLALAMPVGAQTISPVVELSPVADQLADVSVFVCVPPEACDTFVEIDVVTEFSLADAVGAARGDVSDPVDPLTTGPMITGR